MSSMVTQIPGSQILPMEAVGFNVFQTCEGLCWCGINRNRNRNPVFSSIVGLLISLVNSRFFWALADSRIVFQFYWVSPVSDGYHMSLPGLLLFNKSGQADRNCGHVLWFSTYLRKVQPQLVRSSIQKTRLFSWTSVDCPEMADILFARGRAACYCLIVCTACCFSFEQWRT